MGFTTKQKQLNAYRVWGCLLDSIYAIKPRATHRRPEDRAQAKIDAEKKRLRRRWRNMENYAVERGRAAMRERDIASLVGLMPSTQSAFDYLYAAGMRS